MATSVATLLNPVAVPEKNYTARAVVDWVAFVVKLERASHGGYLKRLLEKHGVSEAAPRNAGAGRAATEFLIKLQHPEKYAVINEVISRLEADYGLAEKPAMTGIEVSIDFWEKDAEPRAGKEITARLMKSIAPPVITNPRLVNDVESFVLPDRRAKIDPEMSLYVGNEKDDLLWRVYWKRTDDTILGEDGKRVPKPLPESEWRARAEVRIQGDALAALGITNPANLENFSFERLHALGYYKFCRHDSSVPVMNTIWNRDAARSAGISENSPACVLGMFAQRDKRHRPLKLSRYLETDIELTEAVRHALRGLTRRF